MGGNRLHDEEEHEREVPEHTGYSSRDSDAVVMNNANYTEECGGCHFAYQPGLLPEKSWLKIMTDLQNHFDENAETGSFNEHEVKISGYGRWED
ncbi:MAG TPA: hypothetical protein ENJ41_02735 [Oceanospirillales bacterium]|nr:hypothetical protein [Oceanospirillales bacterium]